MEYTDRDSLLVGVGIGTRNKKSLGSHDGGSTAVFGKQKQVFIMQNWHVEIRN
jgi:hypothetical protein